MITFKLKILVVADPMPFFTPLLIGISDQRPADKPKVTAARKDKRTQYPVDFPEDLSELSTEFLAFLW